MTTETKNIEGITPKMLSRYVEMRRRVDAEMKTAQSLASMLALLRQCGDDKLEVDPVALAHVNELISDSVLNVWEQLDGFIYLVEARMQLGEFKDGD